MIEILSDHRPTLQIFVNTELLIDDTLNYKKCRIEPTLAEEIDSILIKNKGHHSFTANSIEISPNSSQEIYNK